MFGKFVATENKTCKGCGRIIYHKASGHPDVYVPGCGALVVCEVCFRTIVKALPFLAVSIEVGMADLKNRTSFPNHDHNVKDDKKKKKKDKFILKHRPKVPA